MTIKPQPPKRRKGCLLKIVLAIAIIFGASFIHALTAERSQYGRQAPMNPILSMLACGAIVALWFWKPTAPGITEDHSIKPLDKEEDDNEQT
jgi:hypothetical protein